MYKIFFFIFVLETRRKHYPHLVSSFRDDVEAGSGVFPEQGVVGRESFLIRLQDVIVDGALTRGVVTVYHTVQQRQHSLLQITVILHFYHRSQIRLSYCKRG